MTKFAAIGTDGTRLVVWGMGDTAEAALVDAGLQEGVDGVDLRAVPVGAEQVAEIERGGIAIADGWNVYRYDDADDSSKQTLVGNYQSRHEAESVARRIGGQIQQGLDGEVVNP